MPGYWFQDNRGNRIKVAVPLAVGEHKTVSGPLANYRRLTETETEVRGKLVDVERRIVEAEAEHIRRVGEAIGSGKPEPAAPSQVKLETEKLELSRRAAAVPAALDLSEAALVDAIEQARDALQSEADARLVDARERARLALDEFEGARAAMTTERSLKGWLTSFPEGAGRSPGSGSPPLRHLRGANGDATPFSLVVDALRADIDPPKAAAPPAIVPLSRPVYETAS